MHHHQACRYYQCTRTSLQKFGDTPYLLNKHRSDLRVGLSLMSRLQKDLDIAIEGNILGAFLEIPKIFHKIYPPAVIVVQVIAGGQHKVPHQALVAATAADASVAAKSAGESLISIRTNVTRKVDKRGDRLGKTTNTRVSSSLLTATSYHILRIRITPVELNTYQNYELTTKRSNNYFSKDPY